MRIVHKRTGSVLFIFLLISAAVVWGWGAFYDRAPGTPKIEARAAILVDYISGRVLLELNADEAMPPASMTKMMTEYIVLQEVNAGRVRWKDLITVSGRAASTGGAAIGLKAGEKRTVKSVFEAMVVHSANDAAVALAEHIGGERKFVGRMNKEARRLGLARTAVFVDPTGLSRADRGTASAGLPAGETLMSARDAAKLAAALVKEYPEVLDFTSLPVVQGRINTNRMLPALGDAEASYRGMDGLKTGFTDQAGYCFTGTAKRGGKRLISVVMGTGSPEKRFSETRKLLDFGFTE